MRKQTSVRPANDTEGIMRSSMFAIAFVLSAASSLSCAAADQVSMWFDRLDPSSDSYLGGHERSVNLIKARGFVGTGRIVRSQPMIGSAITHFVYLHPADRSLRNDYKNAMRETALILREWYRQQLDGSTSFLLAQPVVVDHALAHPADWYATHDPGADSYYGGDPRMRFWDNVLFEAFALTGGHFHDQENAWIYYVDADSGCDQLGGAGGASVVILPANDLRGLVGEPYFDCNGIEDPSLKFTRNRWIGGQGHELGHAYGLPHPPGCDAGEPTCDYGALMWAGFYYDFPQPTYLREDEKPILLAGPFFGPTDIVFADGFDD